MRRFSLLLAALFFTLPAFAQGIIAKDESSAGSRIITLRSVSTSTGIPAAPGSLSAGDLKISKAGGAEANTAGTFTSLGNGECTYQATAGEVDTAGVVTVRLLKTGYTGLGSALVTSGLYADVRQVNGGATNGYNATLKLKALDISNDAGDAIKAESTGSNGRGLYVIGNGTNAGFAARGGNGTAGVTNTAGTAIDLYPGNSATTDPPADLNPSGKWGAAVVRLFMKDGPGITFFGQRGRANYDYAIGMLDFGDGFGNHWDGNFLDVTSHGSGAYYGPSTPLAWNNSITGNLSGSVGSVTGNVGGNVGGYVARSLLAYGTTDVGSTDTAVKLGAGGSETASAYVGDQLTLSQIGVSRTIVSYDENTKTATVDQAFPSAVPDGLDWSIFPGRSMLARTTHTSATIPNVTTVGSVTNEADTYYADVSFTKSSATATDLYTVSWFKSALRLTSGITSPTIQVVKRSDGTNLIASTSMTQIGSTGSYKYDATGASRQSTGQSYLVIVSATIDGSTRTYLRVIGRDS